MRVPLLDLAGQLAPVRAALLGAVERVVDSGRYVMGPELAAFEGEIAERLGVDHAIGVSSGTDALTLALLAVGVRPGDRVAVPAYSFFASVGPIVRLGAHPAFGDVDPETLALDPNSVPDDVRAIVVVHLFGRRIDVAPYTSLGVPVIEDAAQSFGAGAGTSGTAGCFSFYPSKTLGALGDAGMVVTADAEVAERVRWLRNHGVESDGLVRVVGGNHRLDEIQAASLRTLLGHVDGWIERRRAHAARYDAAFDGLSLGCPLPDPAHVYSQYVLFCEGRDELARGLAEDGVSTELYYPRPLTDHPAYGGGAPAPNAERAARECLAIPVFPTMTEAQQGYVIDCVKSRRR